MRSKGEVFYELLRKTATKDFFVLLDSSLIGRDWET